MNRIFLKTLCAISLCALLLSGCANTKDNVQNTNNDNIQTNQNHQVDIGETTPLFENNNLISALALAFEKDASQITADDCLKVRYLAVGKDTESTYTLYTGFEDYSIAYFTEIVKPQEEQNPENLMEYVKVVPLSYSEEDRFENDLKLFKNVEIFEFYDIKISDVSFLNSFDNLYYGYFNGNGITDISSLEGFNPSTLRELDFTGNTINDWSALMHIADKVIVNYSSQTFTADDGTEFKIPSIIYLSDLTKSQKAENTQTDTSSDDVQENAGDNAKVPADTSEEPKVEFEGDIDWSVLFDD